MTLWYYDGSDDDAQDVLDAALRQRCSRAARCCKQRSTTRSRSSYYATADDMELAILSDNEEGVITLGEVVYSDTAMVAADSAPDEHRAPRDRAHRPARCAHRRVHARRTGYSKAWRSTCSRSR